MKRDKAALTKQLGERISALRKKRDISVERLANAVGIAKGNLSDIENGNRDARYSTLIAIAEGLGISVSQLLRDL